jgi:hypothetical protein
MTTLKSNFLDAAQAWYAAALTCPSSAARRAGNECGTSCRSRSPPHHDKPTIPETARGWQLYTTSSGAEAKAAWALKKAAEAAVEAGKADHMGLMRFVKQNGWD